MQNDCVCSTSGAGHKLLLCLPGDDVPKMLQGRASDSRMACACSTLLSEVLDVPHPGCSKVWSALEAHRHGALEAQRLTGHSICVLGGRQRSRTERLSMLSHYLPTTRYTML